MFYELISYNEKRTTLQSLIKKWAKDYKNLFYTLLFLSFKVIDTVSGSATISLHEITKLSAMLFNIY